MLENKDTKNKRSFLLYLDYKEQFELLSDEQLGQLLRVIMEYEETGNVPKTDGMVKMAFSFIKAQLDRDKEKYEEKCQKNRENGSRGGRPKKETTEEENEEEEKPNGLENNQTVSEKSERFLEKPKKPDNDNDDDNDDEDDNDNDNEDVNDDDVVVDVVDDDSNNDTPEIDDNLQKIIDFYNNNIDMITPYGLEVFSDYVKEMPAELIILAMKRAVERKARNITYIQSILNNWHKKGIKSVLEAEEERENFRNAKNNASSVSESQEEKNARKLRELKEAMINDTG